MGKKTILISNDDGIRAKGLKVLTEIARQFGEVLVVAPHTSRSGMSKAITVDQPLRLSPYKSADGVRLYSCTGTPVDCVKLAFDKLLDADPDLVLSGINHGANSSVSVHYSGTMGATIEGCIHQIPSMGFSLCDYHPDADFSEGIPYISNLIQKVLAEGLPKGTCLNINIPKGKITGVEPCRQGHGRWVEEFDKRKDPHDVDYYWITGYYENMENGQEDTDNHFLSENKISVVPIKVDMTDHHFLSKLKNWQFDNE
jgi:5'-nucleotidase